jgi:hypothetical protein
MKKEEFPIFWRACKTYPLRNGGSPVMKKDLFDSRFETGIIRKNLKGG